MAFVSCVYGGAGGDGGSNAELVWTNPSPDSAFAAQTISIDLSEYDFAIIATKAKNTSLNKVTFDSEHNIETVDFASSLVVPQGYIKGDTARKRSVSVGTTGITFGAGIAGDGTQDNTVAIPYKIYGSKQLTTPPSSFVERQEGAVTGADGSTAAGQFTVTSQQGKAPKLVEFWNTTNLATNTSGLSWNSDYPTTSRAWYGAGSGGTTGTRTVGVAANTYYPTVMSVGANSIKLQCCTGAALYTGTWKYVVEFE